MPKPATLKYLPNDYIILDYGDHVLCALTKTMVPLEQLCYWSVSKQEAYDNANIATQAYHIKA